MKVVFSYTAALSLFLSAQQDVNAFQSIQVSTLSRITAPSPLFMSTVAEAPTTTDEDATEAVEEVTPSVVAERSATGLSMADVRKMISKMTAENFDATLQTLEPYLLNEAGRTMYLKSMSRIAQKAKECNTAVPAGYAKEAKTLAKRRAKQDAFIATKEEERLAREEEERANAEAAAAEALAAAAETEAKEEEAEESSAE